MNILEEIAAAKAKELEICKKNVSIKSLEKSEFFNRKTISLRETLKQSPTGIIAEFKRKSPSKGWINQNARPETVCSAYQRAGASALSVLTNSEYFGGSPNDVMAARRVTTLPILRKEFVIDEYQIIEAKAIGADAVLLIAALLSPQQVKNLATTAKKLGLESILEIHNDEELDRLTYNVDMVGINNRNLADFKVDTTPSFKLGEILPKDFLKISESGLSEPATISDLRLVGFRGFLIGQTFMQESTPGIACKNFIDRLNLFLPDKNV